MTIKGEWIIFFVLFYFHSKNFDPFQVPFQNLPCSIPEPSLLIFDLQVFPSFIPGSIQVLFKYYRKFFSPFLALQRPERLYGTVGQKVA